MMESNSLQAKVQLKILKLIHQVFEAIVNPDEMSKYFISSGSDRLDTGKTVTWRWDDVGVQAPVKVQQVVQDNSISFLWSTAGVETLVTIYLVPADDTSTVVKITESSWPPDAEGIARCLGQTQGWTHMLCCLKAYLEYGINLRAGGIIRGAD
jgi:uncharacterized protein YndB with AHSA1/START domain